MNVCPCCSGRDFSNCCEPFLSSDLLPSTPEALMRSRYTAYYLCNIDYLLETTHPSMRKYYSAKSIEEWAKQCTWLKLEVIKAYDDKVEFHAYFKEDGLPQVHKELSTFKQENGRWYFVDGTIPD